MFDFFVIALRSEVIMTKTNARKWQAAWKKVLELFRSNGKDNATVNDKLCILFLFAYEDMHVVYYRDCLPAESDIFSISNRIE